MAIIYSFLGSFIGFLVTTLYFRVIILPRIKRNLLDPKVGDKEMKINKKSNTIENNKVGSRIRSIILRTPETKLVNKALFDMDEILQESHRIHKKTENLKQSVKRLLDHRVQETN